jgi:hypothetical protein
MSEIKFVGLLMYTINIKWGIARQSGLLKNVKAHHPLQTSNSNAIELLKKLLMLILCGKIFQAEVNVSDPLRGIQIDF